MEHDVVCPSCKAGLVVRVDQARGGVGGEFVSVATHATQEEMQAAKDILADMEAFQREIDELKKKFEEGR